MLTPPSDLVGEVTDNMATGTLSWPGSKPIFNTVSLSKPTLFIVTQTCNLNMRRLRKASTSQSKAAARLLRLRLGPEFLIHGIAHACRKGREASIHLLQH